MSHLIALDHSASFMAAKSPMFKNLAAVRRVQKSGQGSKHLQTQLVDAWTKLGAVHCAVLVLQIREGLSITQWIQTVLIQLRLAATDSEWCPKLTSSGRLNCALHTPLDGPIAPLHRFFFVLRMEHERSSHSVRHGYICYMWNPSIQTQRRGLDCQAEPQIEFVSAACLSTARTSSLASLETTPGLLSSANVNEKTNPFFLPV